MKATIFSKAIPSILLIAGAIDKATFSAIEVYKAVKQYQHGDVVPILDTLSILTNGKFEPARNKAGALNLRANVTPFTVGAKSNFKKLGACLALLDLIDQDATEENGFLFCELAKQHAADLKSAYEATKPKKATVEKDTTVTEKATVSNEENPIEQEQALDVDLALAATIKAIQSGLLDATQLTELRLVLAELPTIEENQLAITH